MISLHTSPLDQPGTGDSGGMNVYVRSLASRLAGRGVEVDVYTRCAGRGVAETHVPAPGVRVIQIPAGPCAAVEKERLGGLVPEFVRSVTARVAEEGGGYDLVHAHYWLSARAALDLSALWNVPLIASFHTLALVKERAPGMPVEPAERVAGERDVVAGAERLLAPTPTEVGHLIDLYCADPERIRLIPPGVDPRRFSPGDRTAARRRLGLDEEAVVLFVGRLQPAKGPDLAVRSLGRLASPRARLLIAGGGDDAVEDLRQLAAAEGVADRVRFLGPVPHADMAGVYAAADVVLVPSRSESFGLAALEAQACGIPVVAAATGGLRFVVDHRRSGLLVGDRSPAGFAAALAEVLGDPALADRLSRGGLAHAGRASWDTTADRLRSVYDEVTEALAEDVALPAG